MKTYFLSLIISILSLPICAETIVYYVNGASADSNRSVNSQASAFATSLLSNGISSQTPIKNFPIIQLESESAFAIQCQKILSQKAFPVSGQPPSWSDYIDYLKKLGESYNSPSFNALRYCATGPGILNMGTITTSLANEIYENIKNGKKIVVAGYSQGNYYVEAAIGLMLYRGNITDLSKIQVVNIGTLTATAISGKYINLVTDQVVYTGLSSWPYSLPGNISPCINACTEIASISNLISVGDAGNSHFLENTYLNKFIKSFLTKEYIPKTIASNITQAIAELNSILPAPTATVSIITPSPQVNSGVIFQPNITASPNGAVTDFEWDFGDGTVQMGTASQITHTYKVADTYIVRLKIKDIKGVTNSTSTTVTVASNNSILSTFQSGFYGAGDDGNGGTCYYKNSATAIVAANEYAMSEAKYCLNVTQTAWVVSSESAGKIFTPNGWISTNSPTVQFNTDSAGVVKYAGNEFHNIGITPLTVGATFPTGAKAFTIGITNTRDRYFVWDSNPTNSYLYTHAPNIASMMSQWNTSQNGQSTLSRTNGFGWAFDTPSSPTALSGVARYYDISVAPICTIVGCSRAVVASATWIRTPFTDGTDSIELRTPVGFSDMNLSGNTGQKVVYFKRPSDAGVLEGYRELSGATRNFPSYNRIHFDTQMQNLNLPKTVN